MCACPGRSGVGTLGDDVAAIAAWGATAVITLIKETEAEQPGVADLGDMVERAGIDWHHLPIADFCTPDRSFHHRWTYTGHVARRRLRAGHKVLVHCRDGLGRTGTVVARLLIEFGMAPDQAIQAVRAARTGAIENDAQGAYVRRCTRCAVNDAYADRVLGCLLGGAVGDGFGYAVEFDNLAMIRHRFGPAGLTDPVFSDGRLVVSDDTQMTLFTADGLITGAEPDGRVESARALDAIRAATLAWSRTQVETFPGTAAGLGGLLGDPALWRRRAPGNTCLSSCAVGAFGTPEAPINQSKGCGGAMRVAPIGLVPALDHAGAFDLAARAAAQTHGHASGYLSAGLVAAIVRHAVDGHPLDAAADAADAIAERWPEADECRAAVARARRFDGDPARMVSALGRGWVGEEALAIALYAVRSTDDVVGAIRRAANHDGDSDSTASIAGQLRGTWTGVAGIPHAWIRRLDVLDPVLEVAGRMIERFGPGFGAAGAGAPGAG